MDELAKIIKIITTIGLTITIAAVLGSVINSLIPWYWLTSLFTILRRLIGLLDFSLDTTALFSVIQIWLNILMAYWLFLAGDWIISRLKK